VIAATGYHRNLEPLVGHLGVLTADGHPAAHGAETHPQARGLHFIGFSEPLSGNLREIRFDARKIARAIIRIRDRRTA
jgi:putative flavoprotein involved in K+ transport